jgi:hypothetical protein
MRAAPITAEDFWPIVSCVPLRANVFSTEIRTTAHSAQRTTAHLLYEGLKSFEGVIGKCAVIRCALWSAPYWGQLVCCLGFDPLNESVQVVTPKELN